MRSYRVHGSAVWVATILHVGALFGCAGAATHSNAKDEGRGGSGAGGTSASGAGAGSAGGADELQLTCLDESRLRAGCVAETPLQLVSAASLGDGATFRSLGGLAALVERMDGPPSVVIVHPTEAAARVLDLEMSASDQITISAVWGAFSPLQGIPAQTVALGCRANGCALFGAGPSDTKLVHIPGFDLPPNVKVSGLAAGLQRTSDTISLGDTLCAYGEGLYCFGPNGLE